MTKGKSWVAEVEEFDGTQVAVLERIFAGMTVDEAAVDEMLKIARRGEERFQCAGTWLLRRARDAGTQFTEAHTLAIVKMLTRIPTWVGQLHLLQILPHLKVPSAVRGPLYTSLKQLTTQENKFVRAWAFGGLYHLANSYPEYRQAVANMLTRALLEESAATKARIRNSVKDSAWFRV
jgi:hypothetical protein